MKISIYIAITPNGMISNPRNVPDWLSPEYGEGFKERWWYLLPTSSSDLRTLR